MARKKSKAGRPRKIDQKIIRKLVEAFKDDFTIGEACRYAGISTETYYQELKRNPGFSDEMTRAQDYPLAMAKKWMMRAIQGRSDGYGNLALKFLERRQRDRYTPKLTLEHEGSVLTYSEIESKTPKAKTPEEARKMAEE